MIPFRGLAGGDPGPTAGSRPPGSLYEPRRLYNRRMPVHRLAEMTWEEVRDLDRDRSIVILPTGATEAHGPHLPLQTDGIIASAMARAGAEKLSAAGWLPLIVPPIAYSAAPFAEAFPGTVSITPAVVVATIVEVARSFARHGFGVVAIANAHFDPAHLATIHSAVDTLAIDADLTTVFPDITRRPWALRLTDEFKSGACHAGQYEGSIVLAERPELVRDDIRASLPELPVSLSTAIADGAQSFKAAGGERAYFGYPANASAEEGRQTVDRLGTILCDAILATIDPDETT